MRTTWRVLRQPRKSPRAIPTNVLSALESVLRPSMSQISHNRLTTCMSAGHMKRITRARGRSLANDDAYRSLHMQIIGRQRA